MARKLGNVFLLPLVYLWECIAQQGGSGKKREHHLPVSAASPPTGQHRPADRPFRPEAGPAESSRQCISSNATSDCSGSSQVWVCKRLTLASVVQHLPLCRRNRTAQFFAATLQNFSYEHVCDPQSASGTSRGITASSASCVPLHSCIPSYVCFG